MSKSKSMFFNTLISDIHDFLLHPVVQKLSFLTFVRDVNASFQWYEWMEDNIMKSAHD